MAADAQRARQRQEIDEVTLVYENPVPTSVGPGDSVSELQGADGLQTAKLSQNSRSDSLVNPNISRCRMTRKLRERDRAWCARVHLVHGEAIRSYRDTVVRRFIERHLKPRCKRRKVESLTDKVDTHATVASAVSPDSSATTTNTTKGSEPLTASQLMGQPSSTRFPPHGRCPQPVKKPEDSPVPYAEFSGLPSAYTAYVQLFHETAEAVTIKGTLVLKDGTTVEANRLQGLEELDVDEQRLVHSRILNLRRCDRKRNYRDEFDSASSDFSYSESDLDPPTAIKTSDQRLLSFADYFVQMPSDDGFISDLKFGIPNLYPTHNMRSATSPLYENDDMMIHSRRFRPWEEDETCLSIQTVQERLDMHPESLRDRIKWFQHLVKMQVPLDKLREHSRSNLHWNEMIQLSKEREHHVNRLMAIRRSINDENRNFPSDFRLSASGEALKSREQLWTALMNCSARPQVKYVPPWRKGRHYVRPGSINVGDVPLHPVPEFLFQDTRSIERRTRFINLIREAMEYSIMDRPVPGSTTLEGVDCRDTEWIDINILWLMGHNFDHATQQEINKRKHYQEDLFLNSIIRCHWDDFSCKMHFLSELDHDDERLQRVPQGDSDSGAETEVDSTSEYAPSPAYVTLPESDVAAARRRFHDKLGASSKWYGKMVIHATKLAEGRWKKKINWHLSNAVQEFNRLRKLYYTSLTHQLLKREVRKHLLLYQGHAPSYRRPLVIRGKDKYVYPESSIFLILERHLDMTHKQIVASMVHSTLLYMHGLDNTFEAPANLTAEQLKVSLIQYEYVHLEGLDPSYTSNAMGGKQRVVSVVHSNACHSQGLDAGYSSNSMGDGPSWIPLTKALQEAIGHVAPSDVDCDITETTMSAFFWKTQEGPPFSWSISWNGYSIVDRPLLFFSYGYKCLQCANEFIGDDTTAEERRVACTDCAVYTMASRLWLVNAKHPLVVNALLMLDTISARPNIRRVLNMSDLTPVKGSFLQDSDDPITADTRIVHIAKCTLCGELVQPSHQRFDAICHKCNTSCGAPVEYAINSEVTFDAAVLGKYKLSAPSAVALVMAGLRLSQTERAIQSQFEHLRFFPSFPLASHDEVKIASCGGVRISCGCGFTNQSMKVHSVTFENKAKLIGSGSTGGFGELKYLTSLATTSRTERHKQQAELMRYFKEVGCQSILVAMLRGECLIYSDKDADISSLASQEVRIVVRGILDLKSKWQSLNHTHLHREVDDLSKDYTNLVVLDAPVFLLIDTFLKRAILKFLPSTFVTRMKLVSKDFEADRLSAAGTIALVFGDDKSEKSMTAKADRADCEKALHVKLEKGMSIDNFKLSFLHALSDYNKCSTVEKFANSQGGEEEQIEFILLLLSDVELRNSVATKFDKMRLGAKLDGSQPPGIDNFWELLTRIHGILENQKLRSISTSGSNKRPRDGETVNTIKMTGDGDGSKSQVCFAYKKGNCTKGSACRFQHTDEEHAPKKVTFANSKGKGKGKPQIKTVDDTKIKVKGLKGGKGGKGKGTSGGKGTSSSEPTYCGRCKDSHLGQTGPNCVMPPCRYCTLKKHKSTNHHLKYCRNKPSDWEHVSGKGNPDKRPLPDPKPNQSPSKRAKGLPVTEWLKSADPKAFRNMRDTINAISQEWESSIAAQTPANLIADETEEVSTLVKYITPPKVKPTAKAIETTHIVPVKVKPTSTIVAVTRNSPKQSHAALLSLAKSKIKSPFGGGRQQHESLIESETVTSAAPLCWNGTTEATMNDKLGFEFVNTIDLAFDTGLMAAEPTQRGCSGTCATQKISVKFLSFDDKSYVMPQVVGVVSNTSMGFTNLLHPLICATPAELLGEQHLSSSGDVTDDHDSDCDWISLANGDTESTIWSLTPTADAAKANRQSRVQRYKQMLEVAIPLQNSIYMFDQYNDDDHIRILAEDPLPQQRHEDIFHLLDEHWMDGILIDSGATSAINIINMDPRSKGKYGAFMLVSKIVPLATTSTFTTYGGNVSDLKILGWAWHRYCMRCSVTDEIVVIVARAYVAFDSTGKYRKIYSPGSLTQFGYIFVHGTPLEMTVKGSEFTSTIAGPSTEAFIFTPQGHAIKCPSIGKGLQVLPILDNTDSDLMLQIEEATEVEVSLLMEGGAHIQSAGGDLDFFNRDAILKDLHHTVAVNTLSIHIQRPVTTRLMGKSKNRRPIHVPVIDPMLTAEDFGVSSSEYSTELAKVMSKIEALHMAAAADFLRHDEEFLKGGRLNAQSAQEKVIEVLNILQELGEGLGGSTDQDVHSLNQLQECAVQAGFGNNLPIHLQPEKLLGFPGVLSDTSNEVLAFQHGRDNPMHLPYLSLPTEELKHRIDSLNHGFGEYQHFSSTENSELNICELKTSGSLQPLGQTHIWIGKPSVIFFNLLYSDRRAHIHIFVDSPVMEVYNLVNTDMWSQFTVHRMAEANISADLISAVLSQGLVSLKQVLTIHHECTDGGPSLIGLLSNLPTSTASLRTECSGGNFTVVSAWPDFDTSLIQHKFNPDCANEGAIQDLLAHHDNLRIAQMAKLLELALDEGSDDEQFLQLQEVCHLIFPDLQTERPDDDQEQHNLLSTNKGKKKGAMTQTKRNAATSAAAPTSNRTSNSGKRKLPVMPAALAQELHARFGHPGRTRLYAALKLFGWLNKFHLPLDIPCLACDLAKARRRSHKGKVRRGDHAGQIWHADLMSSGDVIGMDGSKYAAIFTDDVSGKILAFPILKKSQFSEVMRQFIARLRTLPETMVLDSGGENVSKQFLETCYSYCIHPVYSTKEMHTENLSERSIFTLRDASMTMLASAAMSPTFWPWAIQYAAYLYDFIPKKDGKAPYLHWHDKLPPNLSFPIFGSSVVYRQKEPDLQHQFDLPGHTAKFMGVVYDQYAIWVLDTSISTMPVRRTSEEFQRTYMESSVIDVNDSNYSFEDYAKYGFQDISDPTDPVDIRAYLQTDIQLPADQDIRIFQEAQQFIRRRGRFLRNRGDLSAWEIESLISREWRRKAAQRLNKEYDEIDRGTYLDSLLAGYDSDKEEADESLADESTVRDSSEDTPTAKPLKGCCGSSDSSSLPPHLPPRGQDIASGTFLDTSCEECKSKHFNASSKQMLLCDMCDRGFHRSCIGQTWMSPPEDRWCCSQCLGKEPNTIIEIKLATSSNRKQSKRTSFVTATVLDINQTSKFGKVQVQFANEVGTRSINLSKTRWRLPGTCEEGICYINEDNEIVMLKEPKSWKAIQRIDDPIIRQRWNDACDAEIRGIREANTYKLVDRPSGVRCIPLVWVFKIKQPKVGETIGKFKARCCLLGNIMLASDSDFASPTPRLSTFRYLLSYAAKTGAHVWSADVEQAFLSAAPAEPIYCTFPPGYEDPNGKVMFLLKNLYGSTTAPFQFNCYLANSLLAQGFTPNEYDCCLFTKMVEGSLMMVLCYVDDSASVHISPKVIDDFYTYCGTPAGGNFKFGQLEKRISRFLGFDIQRDPSGFILTQIPLIEKIYNAAKKHMTLGSYDLPTTTPIAKDTSLNDDKPVEVKSMSASEKTYLLQFPYREILGGIGYVALGTRPDISYSYKSHGRWSSCYDTKHCMSLLSFVRYLFQSRQLPLIICGTPGPLIGKSDADWNGTGTAKSTSGWIVLDGASPLSWAARSCTASARSTAEAEFMSISSLTVELVYLKRLIESIHAIDLPAVALYPRVMDATDVEILGRRPVLDDSALEVLRAQEGVGLDLPPQTVIFTDSLSAKAVAEKAWISDRMRHIRYSMFFIKSYIASGDIKLAFIKGEDLCSDIMTKPFGASTSAKGQQMESFFRHRKEVLGHKHFRPQSTGSGTFKLVQADPSALKS